MDPTTWFSKQEVIANAADVTQSPSEAATWIHGMLQAQTVYDLNVRQHRRRATVARPATVTRFATGAKALRG